MGVTAAIIGGSLMQSNEAKKTRRAAKEESERLQAEQDKATAEAQKEKFSAKKREYDTSRSITRRGQSRGRASTILDKKDTLG